MSILSLILSHTPSLSRSQTHTYIYCSEFGAVFKCYFKTETQRNILLYHMWYQSKSILPIMIPHVFIVTVDQVWPIEHHNQSQTNTFISPQASIFSPEEFVISPNQWPHVSYYNDYVLISMGGRYITHLIGHDITSITITTFVMIH